MMRLKTIYGLFIGVICIMSLSDAYAMPVIYQKIKLSSGLRVDAQRQHALAENIRDIREAKQVMAEYNNPLADSSMPLVREDAVPTLTPLTPALSISFSNNEPLPIGLLSSADAQMNPKEPEIDLIEKIVELSNLHKRHIYTSHLLSQLLKGRSIENIQKDPYF